MCRQIETSRLSKKFFVVPGCERKSLQRRPFHSNKENNALKHKYALKVCFCDVTLLFCSNHLAVMFAVYFAKGSPDLSTEIHLSVFLQLGYNFVLIVQLW